MVDHICPKPGAVPFNEYQICVIEWFMKRSNSYLDYTQLSTAVSGHPEDSSPRRRGAGPRQAGWQASRQARAGACALSPEGAGRQGCSVVRCRPLCLAPASPRAW
jgi:hypothetical protein